ncbi:Phenazine biosynthesis PhzF protein [Sesbania bispinosa]|nr:Phenazine biosynthesis PhzF protein [Sesbania bispinosa]
MSMAKKPVKYSVVDAFTDVPFKGNPAALCFLEDGIERDDDWMQGVAAEIKHFQTCFLTNLHGTSVLCIRIRCFSPFSEVNVYAHAFLAAAHRIFSDGSVHNDINIIQFVTRFGVVVTAKKIPVIVEAPSNLLEQDGFCVELDYPADPIIECDLDVVSQICGALRGAPIIDMMRTYYGNDLLAEVSSGENIKQVQPRMDAIANFSAKGIIVSERAPRASGFDIYTRFFCPLFGVNENPVCGGAHCALASYWSKKLGKCDLNACQASARGGVVNIHLDVQRQRVFLRGKAVTVIDGCVLV